MAKVEARDDFTPAHPSIRGRWDYVRKKLRRRGVIEVSKHHPHSDMLDAVQAGIRKVLTEHPELGPKVSLQLFLRLNQSQLSHLVSGMFYPAM